MNLIKQAAEALYPVRPKYAFNGKPISKDVNESRRRICIEDITHFLQFLSQQGDEDIDDKIFADVRQSFEGLKDFIHDADILEFYYDLIKSWCMEALAIGRASNRWIPVTERLPEEKDATEINGVKVVETLRWHSFFEAWEQDRVRWDDRWIEESAAYWRTPSAYPEPPKSEQP